MGAVSWWWGFFVIDLSDQMRAVKLATCSLNQWAMDFEGNLTRTKESIRQARDAGATFRAGAGALWLWL